MSALATTVNAAAAETDALSLLHRTPASDVKKHGWRSLMRSLQAEGKLLVTNHDQPEAVILSVQRYAAFVRLEQQDRLAAETSLQALRARFDDRLAVLQKAGADDRLRGVLRKPARLRGKVKAGGSF